MDAELLAFRRAVLAGFSVCSAGLLDRLVGSGRPALTAYLNIT